MRLKPRRCLIPELLVKRNWTQRQLAEHSGVDSRIISKYAKGTLKTGNITNFYATYIDTRARRLVNVLIFRRNFRDFQTNLTA